MGLPGTGKTTFARELTERLGDKDKNVAWFNADDVRQMHEDWDFSMEGRIRQSQRMKTMAEDFNQTDFVICDFIAPTKEIRNIFDADYVVWMNTEETSSYEDTNTIFERPEYGEWDYVVTAKDAINTVPYFIDILLRNDQPL